MSDICQYCNQQHTDEPCALCSHLHLHERCKVIVNQECKECGAPTQTCGCVVYMTQSAWEYEKEAIDDLLTGWT